MRPTCYLGLSLATLGLALLAALFGTDAATAQPGSDPSARPWLTINSYSICKAMSNPCEDCYITKASGKCWSYGGGGFIYASVKICVYSNNSAKQCAGSQGLNPGCAELKRKECGNLINGDTCPAGCNCADGTPATDGGQPFVICG